MKNRVKTILVMGLMAISAPFVAGAEVVADGVHYVADDASNSASTTYAIFPLIRTGAASTTANNPLCYYERSDNYTNLGALTVPDKVGECTVTAIGFYSFHNSGLTSVSLGKNVKSIGEGAFICNDALSTVSLPDGLTTIGADAFRFCASLKSIVIPATVQTIGDGSFLSCDKLSAVHCRAAEPVAISVAAFNDVASHCTLYVPVGSVERYKAAEGWKDFAEIKEDTVSGIAEIGESESASDVYTIDGRLVRSGVKSLDGLDSGVYIFQGKKVKK